MTITEFARAWNQAESLDAFCEATGLVKQSAKQRAWYYRKTKKMKLQKFQRGRKENDYTEALRVAEETLRGKA